MTNQKPLLFLTALAAILFCVVFGRDILGAPRGVQNVSAASPSVSTTTAAPLPHPTLPIGSQTYQIMSGNTAGPHIVQATINPPDVHVGDKQVLSVVVSSAVNIGTVTALIETDHGTTTVPLSFEKFASAKDVPAPSYAVNDRGEVVPASSLAHGEPENVLERFARAVFERPSVSSAASSSPAQKYVYTGEWTVRDTHNIYYHTTFVATDVTGAQDSVTLAWSDACGIPNSGAWTISGGCTISSLDGVQSGNTTISGGNTLTLNAKFAFTPGNSITITSGHIAIGGGGSIVAGYLYYPNGTVCSGYTTLYFNAASSWSGYQLRTNTSYSGLNGAYVDSDGDGYGAGGYTQFCGTIPGGYTSDDSDCYDGNSYAHPYSYYWSSYNRGDGSYDYNCDGQQTEAQTQTGGGACYAPTGNYQCPVDPGLLSFGPMTNGWDASSPPGCGQSGTYIQVYGNRCTYDGAGNCENANFNSNGTTAEIPTTQMCN